MMGKLFKEGAKGKEKKIDDNSRLDVVEVARVPEILPSLFPSWSG